MYLILKLIIFMGSYFTSSVSLLKICKSCCLTPYFNIISSYFVSIMTTSGKYLYFITKMVQNVFLIKKCLNSIFVNKYFKKPDRNLVGGSAQCTESSNKCTCWMTTTLRNLIKFDFFLTNACYLIIKKYFLKNL